ncbi:amino-acid N-acetyltransferase, partial [Providencia rettgeri]
MPFPFKKNKNTLNANKNSLERGFMKERSTELVDGFRHSVPYINAHRGKTFVIML